MAERLTTGVPIREGYVELGGEEHTVWLEHIWNNGHRTRSLVAPGLAMLENVRERDLLLIARQ